MVTKPATFPRLQESLQAMAPTCRGRSRIPFSAPIDPAMRASRVNWRPRASTPARALAGRGLLSAISWEKLSNAYRPAARGRPGETFWYVSGRSSNEAGFPAAPLCPHLRHEQRQQLQLLLPPGQRCRPHKRDRQHTATVQLDDVEPGGPRLRDRRQSGQQPPAADAHLMGVSPPRRAGDVITGSWRPAWSFQRAERRAKFVLRQPDRQPLRPAHIGGDLALLTASPNGSKSWAIDDILSDIARRPELAFWLRTSWEEICNKSASRGRQIERWPNVTPWEKLSQLDHGHHAPRAGVENVRPIRQPGPEPAWSAARRGTVADPGHSTYRVWAHGVTRCSRTLCSNGCRSTSASNWTSRAWTRASSSGPGRQIKVDLLGATYAEPRCRLRAKL